MTPSSRNRQPGATPLGTTAMPLEGRGPPLRTTTSDPRLAGTARLLQRLPLPQRQPPGRTPSTNWFNADLLQAIQPRPAAPPSLQHMSDSTVPYNARYLVWNHYIPEGPRVKHGEHSDNWKARKIRTGRLVMIKQFPKREKNWGERELFVHNLAQGHTHILPIFAGSSNPQFTSIITPYCEHGSLLTYWKLNRRSLDETYRFPKEVALGVRWLHYDKQILHTDLGMHNIFVVEEGLPQSTRRKVVIGDFGDAKAIVSSLASSWFPMDTQRFQRQQLEFRDGSIHLQQSKFFYPHKKLRTYKRSRV